MNYRHLQGNLCLDNPLSSDKITDAFHSSYFYNHEILYGKRIWGGYPPVQF